MAYSIATDRLNLILDNASAGTDSNTIVEEVFILGALACAGASFLLLWHIRKR